MKKIIILALACIMLNTVTAQSFDGVSIRGSLSSVVANFKAKGYSLRNTKENYAVLDGFVGNKPVEVFVFTTPITKVVFKVNVYLPKKESWASLKNEYLDFVLLFKEKYGQWSNTYNDFVNPYEEGDGYEMSAVELEKTNFMTIWMNNGNANYGVQITKFKQVMIIYENAINTEIMDNERKRLNKNSF